MGTDGLYVAWSVWRGDKGEGGGLEVRATRDRETSQGGYRDGIEYVEDVSRAADELPRCGGDSCE